MQKYRVMVHGQNLLMEVDGVRSKRGFYTHVYVEASRPAEAKARGIEMVRGGAQLKDFCLNPERDPVRLTVKETCKAGPLEGDNSPSTFCFYPRLDVQPFKMNWKAPGMYPLKALAALSAYFLLAWALPLEEVKYKGQIIHLPSIFAQPFAGLAIVLFIRTVISFFTELSLWWIMTRPLPDTPDEPTPARRPGTAKVKRTSFRPASEAETAFARYLQNTGRAADEVPVTADYSSSSSQFGVPLFLVSVTLTLIFLGLGWAIIQPGPRHAAIASGLVSAIISLCLYLRFGAMLVGVSQRLNEPLLFRYVIIHGKTIQRLPLYPSTTTLQSCERVENSRREIKREYAVFACTRGRRRILSPWCDTEADLSPLLARYREAGFAILPLKRPGMTWLLVLVIVVAVIILFVLPHFVN